MLARKDGRVTAHLESLRKKNCYDWTKNWYHAEQSAARLQAEFNLDNNTQADDMFLLRDESSQALIMESYDNSSKKQ